MHDADYANHDELERLLNDPEVPMEAVRVWELLAEIADPSSSRALAPADRGSPAMPEATLGSGLTGLHKARLVDPEER